MKIDAFSMNAVDNYYYFYYLSMKYYNKEILRNTFT